MIPPSIIILKNSFLDVTCTATGDRIDVALAKRRSYNLGFSSFGSRLSRRQALGKKFREIGMYI